MSRLRKLLGEGRLVTHAAGLRTARRARRSSTSPASSSSWPRRGGRAPRPRRPSCGEALALWRGPALADLAYESFAQAEIARLEELRLAALEQRIDADLALGRHAELVGELEALVAALPAAGAAARPADARPVPLGPPGRGAGRLSRRAARAGRGARSRAERGAEAAGAGDPPPEPSLEPPREPEPVARRPAEDATPVPERALLVVPRALAGLDALLALAAPLAAASARGTS